MHHSLCPLLAAASLLMPVVSFAQTVNGSVLPRKDLQVSLTAPTFGVAWRVAAPKEKEPSPGAGLAPTANLAYAAWIEGGAAPAVMFARSIDGGLTWSKPAAIYSLVALEVIEADTLELVATQSSVFVGWLSNLNDTQKALQDLWVIGSADQGQNFTRPLLVSTRNAAKPGDCDTLEADASGGIAHFVWESDMDSSADEDGYYAALRMTGSVLTVFTAETRVNTGVSPGTRDVDNLAVAADGARVLVAWRDRRNLYDNELVSKLSLTVGKDLGTLAETVHTNYGKASGLKQAVVALAGSNGYIVAEDTRNGGMDELYLYFTNDSGQTWSNSIKVSPEANTADVDLPRVVAQGDRVAITWMTDKDAQGLGDYCNDIYIVVDSNKGNDLKANKVTPIRLDDTSQRASGNPLVGGRSEMPGFARLLAMRGDYIVCLWEESWHNNATVGARNEDAVLAESHDGGKTFRTMRWVTKDGSAFNGPNAPYDLDNPELAMTANQDLVLIWQDNRNTTAQVFLSGTKYPELVDQTAQNQGLRIDIVEKARQGEVGIVILSSTGTKPPIVLDPFGFAVNLAFDATTAVALGFSFWFAGVVDAQGVVALPLAPNAGKSFWAAAVGLDFRSGRFTWFTDPIRY